MKNIPQILQGNIAKDIRGSVRFINDFSFPNIKRFYHVTNADTDTIRAFHGHMREEKYVYVPSGKALVCAVLLDHPIHPSPKNLVYKFILCADTPQILHIPSRYANGVRALESQTNILFFSTATLKQSQADDFRFPSDYWGREIWKI